MKTTIVGGSGYVGGELLRLLVGHPQVELSQVTSESNAGRFLHTVHPNLRGATKLKFSSIDELEACDMLFLALPHGSAATRIEQFAELSPFIIDCSADFSLRDPATYEQWYGEEHANPDWLERFARETRAMPEIQGVYRTSGELDYLIRARVSDVAAYDALYQRLIRRIRLADVSASFVMQEIKETTALPLTYTR